MSTSTAFIVTQYIENQFFGPHTFFFLRTMRLLKRKKNVMKMIRKSKKKFPNTKSDFRRF